MDLDTLEGAYDETVVAWLDNAIERARADAQAKSVYCLECVRNELIEMKHESGLSTPPWSRKE